jgi:hypothetical protein
MRKKAKAPAAAEVRLYSFPDLLGGDDGGDFEIYQVFPVIHPFFEAFGVPGLHNLVAGRQVIGDPTADVVEVIGRQSAAFGESAVDFFDLSGFEFLDDKVVHGRVCE